MEHFEKSAQELELVSIIKTPGSNDHYAYSLVFHTSNGPMEKDYWDYFKLINDLSRSRYFIQDHFQFLSACSPHDTSEDTLKTEINRFLKYIFTRPDIMNHAFLKHFFSLTSPKTFGLCLDMSIPKISTFIPLDITFCHGGRNMIVSLQNSSPLSRIGKIWSFIDPEVMGKVKIYEVDWHADQIFKPYSSFDLLNRITSSLYQDKDEQLVLGFDNGEVCLYDMTLGYKVRKIQTLQVSEDPILFIKEAKDNTFVVSLYNIKIFQSDNFRGIGGGSLRKRLGDDQISAFAVSADKETFFIGTLNGELHMYQYNNKEVGDVLELKHVQSFTICSKQTIEKIKSEGSYLFISHQAEISIWKTNYKDNKIEQVGLLKPNEEHQNAFEGSYVTDFLYLPDEKVVMGTYSNGLIVSWSIKDGRLIGIKEDQREKSLGMVLMEDTKKLLTYSYESMLNVWNIEGIEK